MRDESFVEVIVKGAVAGLVGTAAMTAGMQLGPKVLQPLGINVTDKDVEGESEAPAKLADRLAEGVLDTDLGEDEREMGGQAVHWLYGIGWGALYGLVQSKLRLPHLLHGTLFGALVAILAATVVPAMRLSPPPDKQKPELMGMQAGVCFIYGWTTALVFHRISRSGRR